MSPSPIRLKPIRLKRGRYIARLADGETDLRAAQHLRYLVFRDADAKAGTLDEDDFDQLCDHVLVEDAITGRLVCCFRMMTFDSTASINMSYTAQFYDLKHLFKYSGSLVEIGRFCIAAGANDADILRVAWGAVTAHVDAFGIKMLFGCSSFPGISEKPHLDALALLKDRYLGPARWMPQIKSGSVFAFAKELAVMQPDMRVAIKGLPPLLRTYLAMGGWVSDHAAIDHDLGTMHVFTGVEISAIPAARAKALRAIVG